MFSVLLIAALTSTLAFAADLHEKRTNAQHLVTRQEDAWLGWGANIHNNRLAASGATIDTSNVAGLHPVCKEPYSVGVSAAPLVVDGIAYYPTWSGVFAALDYTSCKVLWQTNVTAIVFGYQQLNTTILSDSKPVSRTTPALEGNTIFIGTQANALLVAIDKRNGKLISTVQINKQPWAIITQSPTVWQGKIFIGSSSEEDEAAANVPGYVCCTTISNMNAFTLEDDGFKLLWSQDTLPAGSGFTGASVWGSQPSIDPKRNQVFVGTGNLYSTPPQYDACVNKTQLLARNTSYDSTIGDYAPPNVYQETLLAFDATTGHINWSHELDQLDAWTIACIATPVINPLNCPASPGIDADFGMAPSFVPASEHTPSGEDTLVVGQKNGNLYAVSAETGKVFWATSTSPDGDEGGLIWGIAVDTQAVYYTAANSLRVPFCLQNGTTVSNGAFGALNLTTDSIIWETPVPDNGTSLAPPSIVNDVVLVGKSSPYTPGESYVGTGSLISLDKYTGRIVREWPLDSYFQGAIAVLKDLVFWDRVFACECWVV